jgi:hypothetical protein
VGVHIEEENVTGLDFEQRLFVLFWVGVCAFDFAFQPRFCAYLFSVGELSGSVEDRLRSMFWIERGYEVIAREFGA